MNVHMKISGLLPTVGEFVEWDVRDVIHAIVFAAVNGQTSVLFPSVNGHVHDAVEGL